MKSHGRSVNRTVTYLPILLAILFSNCQEEATDIVSVRGKIINFGSKEPIPDVGISLSPTTGWVGGWFNDSYTGRGVNTKTDADGNFEINLESDIGYLSVWKEGYMYDMSVFPVTYTSGVRHDTVFQLKAEVLYSADLISTFPTDDSHRLDYKIKDSDELVLATGEFNGKGPFYLEHNGIGDTYISLELTYLQNNEWKEKVMEPVFLRSIAIQSDTIYY